MKHPLISQILENGKIKSMTHGFGIGSTGEAHLAVLDDKKYLLRICPDKKTTKKYWGYYRKFKKYNFLPKLLEIRGRYMLFEFIEGRTAYEKDSPKVIYQVGKICAIINNYKVDKGYKRKKSFAEKLQEIKNKKIISRELLAKVEGEYKQLDKKVKLKNSLDAGDVTNDNFIVNQKGKVYFVDIEAIKSNIKGMGIAKGFSVWFKTPEARNYFTRGYDSVSSMDFYTKDYAKLLTIIFLVQRIRFKAEKGEMKIVKRTIKKLEKLLRR